MLFDLGAAAVTATFAAFMGGVLGLPPSQIAVNDVVVTPEATVSTDTSAYVPLQARSSPQHDAAPLIEAPRSDASLDTVHFAC